MSIRTFNGLVAMVAVNRGLRRLCLEGRAPCDSAYLALAAGLGCNQTLETLDLCDAKLNDEFAIALSDIQQQGQHALRRIIFSCTSIGRAGALALTAIPMLRHLEISLIAMDKNTMTEILDQVSQLPVLTVSQNSIGMQAAMAIGAKVGRQAIVVYSNFDSMVGLIDACSPERNVDDTSGVVPGCLVAKDCKTAGRVIDLLRNHAQLQHVWCFERLTEGGLCSSEEMACIEMHQTLNRKIQLDSRKRLIAKEPMSLTEWCDTLGSVADESLDCIYHVVSKWRLEGTVHRPIASVKRKVIVPCGQQELSAEPSKKVEFTRTHLPTS